MGNYNTRRRGTGLSQSEIKKRQKIKQFSKEFKAIPQRTRLIIFGYLNGITGVKKNFRLDELCDIILMFLTQAKIFEQTFDILRRTNKLEATMTFFRKEFKISCRTTEWAHVIATFLHLDHPYIDRVQVGEVLSSVSSKTRTVLQHERLLRAFLERIPYHQYDFVTAARIFLEDSNFVFPEDSLEITRLSYGFLDLYFETSELSKKYKNIPKDRLVVALNGMVLLGRYYKTFSKKKFREKCITGNESEKYVALLDAIHESMTTDRCRISEAFDEKWRVWEENYTKHIL